MTRRAPVKRAVSKKIQLGKEGQSLLDLGMRKQDVLFALAFPHRALAMCEQQRGMITSASGREKLDAIMSVLRRRKTSATRKG